MDVPWKILHLELSEELPSLPSDPEVQGIYVVFWWQGVPLGMQEIPAAQLPMPAAHLMERALRAITPAVDSYLSECGSEASPPPRPHDRPLEQLREQFLAAGGRPPDASVSVVVCTRNRPAALARCLRSLRRLSPRPQEIVVIDNAPRSGATRRLLRGVPGVRYVAEPRPGLSMARNTGIRHSTSDLIAFTDDDVTVHPAWIARLRQGFARPEVMAVTGLVLPDELETEAQLLFQRGHSGFGWGYCRRTFGRSFFASTKRRGVPVWQIGAGANMAFRRKAFEQVGFFDERLGAGAAGCSEDSELWYRVLVEGGQCHYEPAAVVHHYHRRTMQGLKHQMYQYMRGHMAALLIQFEKHGHPGNLYRAFGTLPKYYGRRLLRDATADRRTLHAQIAGCVAGLKFYLQHRQDPPYRSDGEEGVFKHPSAPFLSPGP